MTKVRLTGLNYTFMKGLGMKRAENGDGLIVTPS